MVVDYLIIGQGIAGSALAWLLSKASQRVLVINNQATNQASQVAPGIYNPIAGRYLAKTWLADQLFPAMHQFYQAVGTELGAQLLYPKTIFTPFLNDQEQELWLSKSQELGYRDYLDVVDATYQADQVFNNYGGILIKQAGYLDVPGFLSAIRSYLQAKDCYREGDFVYKELQLGTGVSYRDIQAHQVIFCEGAQAKHNPFFSYLPFRLVKGEILTIQLASHLDTIYNRGVFVLPKSDSQAIVGSTYDWQDLSLHATEKARQALEGNLRKLLKLPYRVLAQQAGIRPATYDRRPWIGLHPHYPQVGIFNGLGTKGVSLAPYWAAALVGFLLNQENLPSEVQLNRIPSR